MLVTVLIGAIGSILMPLGVVGLIEAYHRFTKG